MAWSTSAELWVEPDFRGRGVGTALLYRLGATIDLSHCLVALKALPLRADHAQISTADEIERVKRFYAKNGFTQAQGEYAIKDARLCEAMKKRLAARRPGLNPSASPPYVSSPAVACGSVSPPPGPGVCRTSTKNPEASLPCPNT